MSPADLRALMVAAEQRPTTNAQTIEQARAEATLSGWRGWLPALLDALSPIRRGSADPGERVDGGSSPFAVDAQDPDLGKIGRGHVCKHMIRWPHPCDDCDRAAWEARPHSAEATDV